MAFAWTGAPESQGNADGCAAVFAVAILGATAACGILDVAANSTSSPLAFDSPLCGKACGTTGVACTIFPALGIAVDIVLGGYGSACIERLAVGTAGTIAEGGVANAVDIAKQCCLTVLARAIVGATAACGILDAAANSTSRPHAFDSLTYDEACGVARIIFPASGMTNSCISLNVLLSITCITQTEHHIEICTQWM